MILRQFSTLIVVSLLSMTTAVAGRLCTQTETTLAGGGVYTGYYHVTFNTGDDATVDGTQCTLLPSTGVEDCTAAYGAVAYENGIIELATSGSNDVTVAPYGRIVGFATRHTEIDAATNTGVSTLITNYVVAGKVTQQVDTGTVKVVDCPKPTKTDRENTRALKKWIKGTSK